MHAYTQTNKLMPMKI